MSAPKLRAFLSSVEPDGTVLVRVDRSGKVEAIDSLRVSARRMDAAFGMCLHMAGRVATSTDELDDMVDMSLRAVHWLQSCCLQLRGGSTMNREGYIAIMEQLIARIEALVPTHPEILTLRSPWDLFRVEGFNCTDLGPSLAQASECLAEVKRRHAARLAAGAVSS